MDTRNGRRGFLKPGSGPRPSRRTSPPPARSSGGATWHGSRTLSGDFLEDFRLIEALRNGVPPDYDVYDAATWSVVSALTEKSVADRSRPVDFPDFTKGKWKTSPPVRIMGV